MGLIQALDELRRTRVGRFVICLDDVEVMAGLGRSGIDGLVLVMIRALAEKNDVRLGLDDRRQLPVPPRDP